MPHDAFWDDPAVVARFAGRDPDHRLAALLDDAPNAARLRVLDLGCAGGRNTVLLAERGCDVHAVDLSPAMVAETRRRVASVLGEAAARARVRRGAMDDLSPFEDAAFDLVVALGVFHQARRTDEWHRAVDEAARVLRPGGGLLSATFAPGTDFTGTHGRPVPGADDVYEHLPGERGVFFDAGRMDALMREHGLVPHHPTETVVVPLESGGQRVTVNAHYRKADGAGS